LQVLHGLLGLHELRGLRRLPGLHKLRGLPGLQVLQVLPGLHGLQALPALHGLHGLRKPEKPIRKNPPAQGGHAVNPIKRYPRTAMALVMLACMAQPVEAEQGDITLHTVSAHVGISGLNNINPGIGYDLSDTVRVGAFYNSYRKPAVYALRIFPVTSRLRVGLGVVTGYRLREEHGDLVTSGKATSVLPALAVEFDITRRLSLAVLGQAINLEVKL